MFCDTPVPRRSSTRKKHCMFQGSQASIACPCGDSSVGMNMGEAQWRSDTDKGNSKYREKSLYDRNCSQLLNATHIRHTHTHTHIYIYIHTYTQLQSVAHRN